MSKLVDDFIFLFLTSLISPGLRLLLLYAVRVIPFLPERKLPPFSSCREVAGWRCAGGVAKRPTLPIWHTHVLLQRRRGGEEGRKEGGKAACSEEEKERHCNFSLPSIGEKLCSILSFSLFFSLSLLFSLSKCLKYLSPS